MRLIPLAKRCDFKWSAEDVLGIIAYTCSSFVCKSSEFEIFGGSQYLMVQLVLRSNLNKNVMLNQPRLWIYIKEEIEIAIYN